MLFSDLECITLDNKFLNSYSIKKQPNNIIMKAYSLLSWNIEHFGGWQDNHFADRIDRVTGEIKQVNPDIFALYEVEGSEVFSGLVNNFPGYSFHITEGPQVQEILVGVRGGITSFFTQKVTFKSGVHLLRPGALLTLEIKGNKYPILFLHLKSHDDPRVFGLRDDMLRKAIKFAKVLGTEKKPANYLFIGDLNTMGMDYYFKKDISADIELDRSDYYAERDQWIKDYSDHAYLYLEVEKVV